MDLYSARSEIAKGKTIYDMNLRVAYYARVSTDKEEQLNSLENQKHYFEDYIKECKNWTLMGSYVDEGISGTSTNRRESFLQMVRDGQNGKFDMLLTKEVSRFARNTVDSIQYTQHLLKYGVIVNFLADNINTIYLDSEFRLTLMSSMAQDEVRKLSERVKFGLKRSVKDGRVLGGGNITGYDKKGGKLIINEKESIVIKMLFNLYASGNYGFKMISDKLKEKGFLNTLGKPYDENVLSRMLQNPKYKGFYCAHKSYVEDYKTHRKIKVPKEEWLLYKDNNIPALVSEELWNRANSIYERRKRAFHQTQNKKNYYLEKRIYTGKLVCMEHGHNFIRRASGHRYSNPVWQCSDYYRGGVKVCASPLLYERELNHLFKQIIISFIGSIDDLKQSILDDYLTLIEVNSDFKVIKRMEDNLFRLKMKKDKLLELSVDGRLSSKEFEERNNKFNGDIAVLESELSKLKRNQSTIDIYEQKRTYFVETLRQNIDIDDDFDVLFNLMIRRVNVSKINSNRKHVKLEILFTYTPKPQIAILNFNKPIKSVLECSSIDINRARCIGHPHSTSNGC